MTLAKETRKQKKFYSVYRIWNIQNGKSYVGVTSKTVSRRLSQHFASLKANRHSSPDFQADYDLMGVDVFEHQTLEVISGVLDADRLEREYIAQFNSFKNGYNMNEGGLNPPKRVTWNGTEYRSIRRAAKALDISVSVMHNRVKKGYTCDEDIPYGSGGRPKPCTWNGVQYPTQKAAAEALGISCIKLSYRLKKGYTCDADVPPSKSAYKSKRPYTWNGIEYPSVVLMARANKTPWKTMLAWVYRGYTCDEDVERKGGKIA